MKLFRPTSTSAPAATSVQFVPGDFFFMRRFELPAGTAADEVAGFVELRLEELSPFPLDQLHHGHLRATDGSAVFVYAAYRRRLPAGQMESWSTAQAVLPDFAPALKLRFAASTVVLVRSAAALTALYFDADRELPARGASRALPVDTDETALAEARRAVLALVGAGTAREVQLETDGTPQARAQGLTFQLAGTGRADEAREVVLPTADLWAMDVREPEFIAAQRKRMGIDLLFWRIVQGAVAAMVLLVLGELLLLAGAAFTSWQERRYEARQPDALALDAKNSLATGLENFRGRAVHPFEMFKALGAGRPATLYFTNVKIEGLRMEISGVAGNMAEYNTYMSALRNVPQLAAPPVEDGTSVREGGTTFKIIVTFKPDVLEVARSTPAP